jgi:hypothetical protein
VYNKYYKNLSGAFIFGVGGVLGSGVDIVYVGHLVLLGNAALSVIAGGTPIAQKGDGGRVGRRWPGFQSSTRSLDNV